MKKYIAFDSHKHYTLVEWEKVASGRVRQRRVEHRLGAIRACPAGSEPGMPVAVESLHKPLAALVPPLLR
jgi:hypothetical protein